MKVEPLESPTLISLSNSPLDRSILCLFSITTGKPWAEVTRDEAMIMVSHGHSLREAFPKLNKCPPEVIAIIDQANIAEGLLSGYLNSDYDQDEDWVCDDCRVEESGQEACDPGNDGPGNKLLSNSQSGTAN